VHAGVLQDVGGGSELLLVAGDALEVELRLLDGLAPERALEEMDVGALVVGGDLEERVELRVLDLARRCRLVIEGTLEVFERERVVQDADVARPERARRRT